MKPLNVEAVTISDAWFQLLYSVFDPEYAYIQPNQRGSYEKEQFRRQFHNVMVTITRPWENRIVTMPEGSSLPPPCDQNYVDTEYFPNYLMNPNLEPNETYRYSSRIHVMMNSGSVHGMKSTKPGTQFDRVVEMLRATPFTNQATIEIGSPYDLDICLDKNGKCDPPCLRTISFKSLPFSEPPTLQMSVYFRSWDLWSGFPGNMAALELLKQFVCDAADLVNGPLIAFSDGLHLYEMYDEIAKSRLHR